MTKKISKKYLLFLLGSLLAFTIVLFQIIKRPPQTPKLLASKPVNNAVKVELDQTIGLTFDQPISSSNINVASTPNEEWTITNLNPNTISLAHRFSFLPFTNYSLTINQGSTTLTTLKFQTVASQGDPRLVQTIEEQMKIDYPLAKKTPFQTTSLRAVYSSPLTLEITLLTPGLTSAEAISEVKAWVAREGGDVDKHQYKVVSPAP